jgi:hypothetical protein
MYSDTLRLDGFPDTSRLQFSHPELRVWDESGGGRFLDVHGRIGAGRFSTFFGGKTVEVRENGFTGTLSLRNVDPGNDWGIRLYTCHSDRWIMLASLFIDEEVIGNSEMVVIDPGESDLVIPFNLWTAFHDSEDNYYSLDDDGRVHVPCSMTGRLANSLDIELELQTRSGQSIPLRLHSRLFEIPAAEIRVTFVESENASTCPIRMRVAFHDNALMTIGRILLRSVDALRFNYAPLGSRVTASTPHREMREDLLIRLHESPFLGSRSSRIRMGTNTSIFQTEVT